MFKIFFKKYWQDIFCILLLTLTLPLFFYKLGQTSLISWDEAWYGGIAKQMVKTGDPIHMIFNNKTFYDQPPGGIWPIALSYKLLGVSEFSTRLPSAIAGFLSLITLYLLGAKLFNRVVGFTAAFALSSTTWFLLRSRQGDLDTPLVLFFLLTFLLAILAAEKKKYFFVFSLTLGYLTTIKASLPFAIVPTLIIIFWQNKLYRKRDYLVPIISVLLFLGSWLLALFFQSANYVEQHFSNSSRNASLLKNDYAKSIKTYKDYLYFGIGRWFWLGFLSIFAGLVLRQKRFLIITVFFICYSLPLLTSPRIEIWHLIPLYPFMLLAFIGLLWVMGENVVKSIIKFKLPGRKIIKKYPLLVISIPILTFGFYLTFVQLYKNWYQIVDIPAYQSDEEILSKEAGKHSHALTIDSDFIPAAVFYSDKEVTQYSLETLDDFFNKQGSHLIITYQWRLDKTHIDPAKYEIFASNRDKILVLKK